VFCRVGRPSLVVPTRTDRIVDAVVTVIQSLVIREPERAPFAEYLKALALMIPTTNYLSITLISTRFCRVTPPKRMAENFCWPAPILVLHMVPVLPSVMTEDESTAQAIPIGPRQIVASTVCTPPTLLGQFDISYGTKQDFLLADFCSWNFLCSTYLPEKSCTKVCRVRHDGLAQDTVGR